MIGVHCLTIVAVVLKIVCGQKSVGDQCTLKSTQAIGECKLFLDCSSAREELQKFNRFPQTCGFQGTQPIICCPTTEPPTQPPRIKPGEVSKQKCKEYSKYVYEEIFAPTLVTNGQKVVRNACGHKEFPHMAAIGFEPTPDDIQWLCGGSILSERYVLTAAHCLSDHSQGDAKWIKVGVTNLNDSSRGQQLRVKERIVHPDYRASSHYHDIGILKLERPIRLKPRARPACLHLNRTINTDKVVASGWGHTSWGGLSSNSLLKVIIDLHDHASCNQSYKYQIGRKLKRGIDDEIQICAGTPEEGKDTCQGDSGGPLQVDHVGDELQCMYDIIGVTSFGNGCAGSPGVYVRVSHYIKWIEEIVWS